MKNLMKITFAMVIASMVLFSCSKDDDGTTSTDQTNYVEVGDQTFSGSPTATIINFGLTNTKYQYQFIVVFPGTNNQCTISYNFYSANADYLASGEYTFYEGTNNNGEYNDFTYDFGGCMIASIDPFSVISQENVTSGTVSVARSASEYTITWNTITEGGVSLKGTYKGTPTTNKK